MTQRNQTERTLMATLREEITAGVEDGHTNKDEVIASAVARLGPYPGTDPWFGRWPEVVAAALRPHYTRQANAVLPHSKNVGGGNARAAQTSTFLQLFLFEFSEYEARVTHTAEMSEANRNFVRAVHEIIAAAGGDFTSHKLRVEDYLSEDEVAELRRVHGL